MKGSFVRVLTLLLALLIMGSNAEFSAFAQRTGIASQVRAAIRAGDFGSAAAALDAYKQASGANAVYLEALSWMGRGQLAAKHYTEAARDAAETLQQSAALLKTRPLDADMALPIAVGAAIEVKAQVLNAMGQKSEAVAFLRDELKRFYSTSIRTRIQKNINLISLDGKPAPPLDVRESLGAPVPTLASLRGKPVILFFWAHWCGECKGEVSVLARLQREYGPKGLVVIAPTQPYGYVAGGEDAPRAQELPYIKSIYDRYYANVPGMTVPVSEENFKVWGSSTTPTIVLIDRKGIVRLYHPGPMPFEDLQPKVAAIAG